MLMVPQFVWFLADYRKCCCYDAGAEISHVILGRSSELPHVSSVSFVQ